jgi:hypothetical protein
LERLKKQFRDANEIAGKRSVKNKPLYDKKAKVRTFEEVDLVCLFSSARKQGVALK